MGIYINGGLNKQDLLTAGAAVINDFPIYIGADALPRGGFGGRWINGLIDEVRISNIARTAEEIRAYWWAHSKQEPVAIAEPGLDVKAILSWMVASPSIKMVILLPLIGLLLIEILRVVISPYLVNCQLQIV